MKNVTSLYIHIPYCLSKCKYCDFFSIVNSEEKERIPQKYIQALCNEIEFRLSNIEIENNGTIYIGGGTPSLLLSNQLSKILDTVNKFIQIKNISEITIEVNPDDVTENLLKLFSDCGITRLSMGLQSMTDKVLRFAGRRANNEININALNLIKKNWKGSFSVDLISGLPEEDNESFIQGLKTVLSYNPDHISLYSLTIEDETAFGKLYNSNQLDYDWDFADSMWLLGRNFLIEQGYNQYEVSNFSKKEKECLHNLTYWNHKNYIGIGSGGTGTIYPERYTNTTNLHEYIEYWNNFERNRDIPQNIEKIDLSTEKIEFFMMGLRKLSGIKKSEYLNYFNQNFPENVEKKLKEWSEKKLLQIISIENDVIYRMTFDGILFLNKLLEELFICFEE